MTRHVISAATALLATLLAAPVTPAAAGSTASSVANGRIAYTVDPGSGNRIKTVWPDGTHRSLLVGLAGASVESPDWSPDGGRLVFSVNRGDTCSVVLARADGSHRRNLTRPRTGCESTPTFTPDGRRIVAVVQRCEACRTKVWGMDLRGRGRHLLFLVPRNTSVPDIAVSPDGSRLAYVAEHDAPFRRALFTAHRDGSHRRMIAPYRSDVGAHFGWAPDGRHLVYTKWSQNPDGHRANVVVVRPDGSHPVHLTHVTGDGISSGGATYSPDGRWIVFRYENDNNDAFWLVRMRADGSHKTRILRLDNPPQGTAWAPRRR